MQWEEMAQKGRILSANTDKGRWPAVMGSDVPFHFFAVMEILGARWRRYVQVVHEQASTNEFGISASL